MNGLQLPFFPTQDSDHEVVRLGIGSRQRPFESFGIRQLMGGPRLAIVAPQADEPADGSTKPNKPSNELSSERLIGDRLNNSFDPTNKPFHQQPRLGVTDPAGNGIIAKDKI
jgi:hypothetical protein